MTNSILNHQGLHLVSIRGFDEACISDATRQLSHDTITFNVNNKIPDPVALIELNIRFPSDVTKDLSTGKWKINNFLKYFSQNII